MFPQQRFKPTRQALMLALIVAAYPIGAHAAAGRLDFVIGRVVAAGADGKERVLAKGSEIDSGDAVSTAVNARAQIRFTDGAFMSLQPNTTFKVDDYRYAGKTDGSEKSFFSLLKGGLRTITGAIGHGKNRDAYQVSTPAATIGIRGTGYTAQLGNSLSVSVGEGAVALLNNGGELVLKAGQTGYVKDFNTAPQLTFEKTSTPPAPLGSSPKPKDSDPQPCPACETGKGLGNTTLTNAVGVMSRSSSIAYGQETIATDSGGTLVMNDSMNRVYYQDGTSGTITSFTQATLDKTTGPSGIASYGYDGIVSWGRWYGTFTYTENGVTTTKTTASSAEGFHGVAGLPATLPTVGTATYTLSGATNPTDGTHIGYGTGGSISVTFGASPSLSGDYTYHLDTSNYTLYIPSTPISGSTFSTTSAQIRLGAATLGPSASVDGFFAGANAERIGIAFQGTGGYAHDGAAVFSQHSYTH
jgi:hypothetical protein